MALSTTQSIWRSGGGDTTRTAYCGSGNMTAQFYIADASVATDTKVMNKANGQNLILPAGAVVTNIRIPSATASTGHVNLGTLGYTSGTETSAAIATNLPLVTGSTGVGSVISGTPSTELAYVTVKINTDGTGAVSGYIEYFVIDPLTGQQNV
jgi:hypothetical protein